MNCQHVQKLLHAYHDGELDIAGAVQVDEHLGDCPACAGLMRNLSNLSTVLRNDALRFQAPPALRQRMRVATEQAAEVESDVGSRRPWFRHSGWAAAAAIALVALVFAFQIPRHGDGDRMIAEITSSHVRSLMANHLMDVASTDQHTVKPWFVGKLDFAPPVKDLRSEGFPLIGGRLDFVDAHPAAALVYGRQKHVINLFIWPERSSLGAAPRAAESSAGYHLVRWSNSEMSFWAVSDLNEKELMEFVKLWAAS
jgi:anti-sigma factor RsiW